MIALSGMLDNLRDHPSIVIWVAFKEGWGQFDTERITAWIKQYDPTRLVDNASGWTDRNVGDVHDLHSYPAASAPQPEPARAVVQGEFGGLGFPIRDHVWETGRNWGYVTYADRDELEQAYEDQIDNLAVYVGQGTAPGVYTQTTDCESEVNGLMTYDRAMLKFDKDKMRAANEKLYGPPPRLAVVVPTGQPDLQTWRYTTAQPASGWEQPAFDDSAWTAGRSRFGSTGRSGSRGRGNTTEWSTPDIWLRSSFELSAGPFADLRLSVQHDDAAEVYLNGLLAGKFTGYGTMPLATLKPGRNTLAVHCHQESGGQLIDVGFVRLIAPQGK